MRHEMVCGCGWAYSTNDRYYGSLYVTRAYKQHLASGCPLKIYAERGEPMPESMEPLHLPATDGAD